MAQWSGFGTYAPGTKPQTLQPNQQKGFNARQQHAQHYLPAKALLTQSYRAPNAPPGREPKTAPAWPRPSRTEQRATEHNYLDPTPSREDLNPPIPQATHNAT